MNSGNKEDIGKTNLDLDEMSSKVLIKYKIKTKKTMQPMLDKQKTSMVMVKRQKLPENDSANQNYAIKFLVKQSKKSNQPDDLSPTDSSPFKNLAIFKRRKQSSKFESIDKIQIQSLIDSKSFESKVENKIEENVPVNENTNLESKKPPSPTSASTITVQSGIYSTEKVTNPNVDNKENLQEDEDHKNIEQNLNENEQPNNDQNQIDNETTTTLKLFATSILIGLVAFIIIRMAIF